MKNNDKGILVVEASIALTAFMFFILFFLSFSRVYRAQELVAHATFQTAQTMAVESYTRETIGEQGTLGAIAKLSDFITSISGGNRPALLDSYSSYGKVANLKKVISDEFAYSIGDSVDAADAKLKQLGVKDGLSGIDFSGTSITDSLITIKVTYKLKLQFNFFGVDELTLNKIAVCKAFAKIGEDNAIAGSGGGAGASIDGNESTANGSGNAANSNGGTTSGGSGGGGFASGSGGGAAFGGGGAGGR